MSDDLIELEPLLAQYDPGKILIGPLLNLSLGSNFRSFYIAGNGSKIYGSIGLGFVELEDNAQRQRADIVDKLKSRFREIVILDSHLEMAQAVHKLWPNEETVRVLELAALEAGPPPAPAGGNTGAWPADLGQQFLPAIQQQVAHGKTIDRVLAGGPPSQSDRAQQQRQSKRFPAAVLGMQSLIPVGNVAKPAIAGRVNLALAIFRFGAVGSVVGLLAGIMVFSAPGQVDQAMSPPVSPPMIAVNNGPSPAVAAPTASTSPNQSAKANEPPATAVSGTSSPPPAPPPQLASASAQVETVPVAGQRSQPPHAATSPNGTMPVSRPQSQSAPAQVTSVAPRAAPIPASQSQPPQAAAAPSRTAPVSKPRSSPATQLDADAISMLTTRAETLVKNGDFASARLLLRRAAEAGSASAALMLGATFDPRMIHELGPMGIEPDVAQARRWYEKAAELGSDIAAQRLTRLTQEQ